jgi:hypothetical protein
MPFPAFDSFQPEVRRLSVYAFPVYALAHVGVFVWCVSLVSRRHAPGAGIVAMISAGLIYDNLIVALGMTIGAGALLEMLSWPRFALHALLTPFMLVAALQFGAAAGVAWAHDRRSRIAVRVLVVSLIALGVFENLLGLEIAPGCFDGVLRYTSNLYVTHYCTPDQDPLAAGGLPIPSIAGNAFAFAVGFALWRRAGWPWLMLGSLLMFVAAGVPVSGFGTAPANGGEVLLQVSMAATAARFAKRMAAS